MCANLEVSRQLQREQEIFSPGNRGQRFDCLALALTLAEVFEDPAQPLAHDRPIAVAAIEREVELAGDDVVVMPIAVMRAPLEVGGNRRQARNWRQPARAGQDHFGIAFQRRMAIHAIALQCHPVGPDVAFLKNMDVDPTQLRHPQRNLVHRPAIAVKHQIGDPPGPNEAIEEHWPVPHPPAIACRAIRPVIAVTA